MTIPADSLKLQYGFFHGNSKLLTKQEYTYLYNSTYKHGHIVLTQEIIAETLPYFTTATDVDNWIIENPGILKKYTTYPLTAVGGSNNQLWCIKDSTLGNKWMKPMILPELIPEPTSNAKANGYLPTLYQSDGTTPILGTDGTWWFDPYQGVIKFASDQLPATLGWGIPRITCYIYIGKTLDKYLEELKPITYKYQSTSPSVIHSIPHNLSSMDLNVNIVVEDPISKIWSNELAGVTFIDNNNIRIDLTTSSNIRASIQLIP